MLGTKCSIYSALKSYLIFSLSRVMAYIAIGVMTFIIGRMVSDFFPGFDKIIRICAGTLIIILAVTMLIKDYYPPKASRKSLFALGALIGFLPCVPLVSVFTYSTLVSKGWTQAFLYSGAFGIGTLISPLLLISVFTGFIPRFTSKFHPAYGVALKALCALILILIGAQLIWRAAYV
jgi:sulfite exporter TauE/SafE